MYSINSSSDTLIFVLIHLFSCWKVTGAYLTALACAQGSHLGGNQTTSSPKPIKGRNTYHYFHWVFINKLAAQLLQNPKHCI